MLSRIVWWWDSHLQKGTDSPFCVCFKQSCWAKLREFKDRFIWGWSLLSALQRPTCYRHDLIWTSIFSTSSVFIKWSISSSAAMSGPETFRSLFISVDRPLQTQQRKRSKENLIGKSHPQCVRHIHSALSLHKLLSKIKLLKIGLNFFFFF